MNICKNCISNIQGYCIEYESKARRKECEDFVDNTFASMLCDLMCPEPEDADDLK